MDITEKRPEPEPTQPDGPCWRPLRHRAIPTAEAMRQTFVDDGATRYCGPPRRLPLCHRATEPTAKPTEEEARADEQTKKEEDGK